jgi:hypothetical protein
MTDIAALIKRVNWALGNPYHGDLIKSSVLKECREALSRLTIPPLPEDRIAQATKLLRERIPLVLKFESGAAYSIMVGVEDLARDILALASPASPLPEDIAGLIADVEEIIREGLETPNLSRRDNLRKTVAALRAQAQENEKLRASQQPRPQDIIVLAERIRELEVECDTLRNSVDAVRNEYVQRYMDATSRIIEVEAWLAEEKELSSTFNMLAVNHCLDKHKVEAELDAIRAKTIEECAQAAEDFQPNNLALWIARHIRALAQTEDKSGN